MRTALGSLLLALAVAGPAAAQPVDAPPAYANGAAPQTVVGTASPPAGAPAEQPPDYPGVVPGAGHEPPAARRAARAHGSIVTWPGFQITPNGTRIFIQSTQPIDWGRSDAGGNVVVVIRNARVDLHNNANPLVTEHFAETPVARATLERHGRNVNLVIEMKVATTAAVSTNGIRDGYYYLFVDFPGGDYPVPASELPTVSEQQSDRMTSRSLGLSYSVRQGRSRTPPPTTAPGQPATPPPAGANPPAPVTPAGGTTTGGTGASVSTTSGNVTPAGGSPASAGSAPTGASAPAAGSTPARPSTGASTPAARTVPAPSAMPTGASTPAPTTGAAATGP